MSRHTFSFQRIILIALLFVFISSSYHGPLPCESRQHSGGSLLFAQAADTPVDDTTRGDSATHDQSVQRRSGAQTDDRPSYDSTSETEKEEEEEEENMQGDSGQDDNGGYRMRNQEEGDRAHEGTLEKKKWRQWRLREACELHLERSAVDRLVALYRSCVLRHGRRQISHGVCESTRANAAVAPECRGEDARNGKDGKSGYSGDSGDGGGVHGNDGGGEESEGASSSQRESIPLASRQPTTRRKTDASLTPAAVLLQREEREAKSCRLHGKLCSCDLLVFLREEVAPLSCMNASASCGDVDEAGRVADTFENEPHTRLSLSSPHSRSAVRSCSRTCADAVSEYIVKKEQGRASSSARFANHYHYHYHPSTLSNNRDNHHSRHSVSSTVADDSRSTSGETHNDGGDNGGKIGAAADGDAATQTHSPLRTDVGWWVRLGESSDAHGMLGPEDNADSCGALHNGNAGRDGVSGGHQFEFDDSAAHGRDFSYGDDSNNNNAYRSGGAGAGASYHAGHMAAVNIPLHTFTGAQQRSLQRQIDAIDYHVRQLQRHYGLLRSAAPFFSSSSSSSPPNNGGDGSRAAAYAAVVDGGGGEIGNGKNTACRADEVPGQPIWPPAPRLIVRNRAQREDTACGDSDTDCATAESKKNIERSPTMRSQTNKRFGTAATSAPAAAEVTEAGDTLDIASAHIRRRRVYFAEFLPLFDSDESEERFALLSSLLPSRMVSLVWKYFNSPPLDTGTIAPRQQRQPSSAPKGKASIPSSSSSSLSSSSLPDPSLSVAQPQPLYTTPLTAYVLPRVVLRVLLAAAQTIDEWLARRLVPGAVLPLLLTVTVLSWLLGNSLPWRQPPSRSSSSSSASSSPSSSLPTGNHWRSRHGRSRDSKERAGQDQQSQTSKRTTQKGVATGTRDSHDGKSGKKRVKSGALPVLELLLLPTTVPRTSSLPPSLSSPPAAARRRHIRAANDNTSSPVLSLLFDRNVPEGHRDGEGDSGGYARDDQDTSEMCPRQQQQPQQKQQQEFREERRRRRRRQEQLNHFNRVRLAVLQEYYRHEVIFLLRRVQLVVLIGVLVSLALIVFTICDAFSQLTRHFAISSATSGGGRSPSPFAFSGGSDGSSARLGGEGLGRWTPREAKLGDGYDTYSGGGALEYVRHLGRCYSHLHFSSSSNDDDGGRNSSLQRGSAAAVTSDEKRVPAGDGSGRYGASVTTTSALSLPGVAGPLLAAVGRRLAQRVWMSLLSSLVSAANAFPALYYGVLGLVLVWLARTGAVAVAAAAAAAGGLRRGRHTRAQRLRLLNAELLAEGRKLRERGEGGRERERAERQ